MRYMVDGVEVEVLPLFEFWLEN